VRHSHHAESEPRSGGAGCRKTPAMVKNPQRPFWSLGFPFSVTGVPTFGHQGLRFSVTGVPAFGHWGLPLSVTGVSAFGHWGFRFRSLGFPLSVTGVCGFFSSHFRSPGSYGPRFFFFCSKNFTDLYVSFSAWLSLPHAAPRALPTSPKVKAGLALTILGRISSQKTT